ncbi:hypothetical protein LINGRAPRIM_LOCUS3076 [Linum grandiflorum]
MHALKEMPIRQHILTPPGGGGGISTHVIKCQNNSDQSIHYKTHPLLLQPPSHSTCSYLNFSAIRLSFTPASFDSDFPTAQLAVTSPHPRLLCRAGPNSLHTFT